MTDLDRFAGAAAVDHIERLDDGDEFGLGTRWRETRTMFGRQASEEMIVTDFHPGRQYTTQAHNHGMKYESVVSVAETESGCRITMSFSAEGGSLVARLFAASIGRLFEPATRRMMAADLAAIAAAAEDDDPDVG